MANHSLAVPRKLLERYIQEAGEAVAKQNEALGKRIKQARDGKRWKQKELAAAVNVEPVTVSRWERGVNMPDLGKLERIAEATGRPLTFFVQEPAATPSEIDGLRDELRQQRALTEALLREFELMRQAPRANDQAGRE